MLVDSQDSPRTAGALRVRRALSRHHVSTHRSTALDSGWEFVGTSPDAVASPTDLDALVASEVLAFQPMPGACGIASALEQLGELTLDAPPDLDGRDWWIRCAFSTPMSRVHAGAPHGGAGAAVETFLVFEGLATIVDVWLNGTLLGRAENMFVAWEADVTSLLATQNELVLCARALSTRLAPRRPRARWRSPLLGSQEWRWHRTAQLGRMPGFGPRVPLVGPWRAVRLEQRVGARVLELAATPSRENDASVLTVNALLALDDEPHSAVLQCGSERLPVELMREAHGWRCAATLRSASLAPWWPHTHGLPALHDCALHIDCGSARVTLALGPVGFRSVTLDSSDGGFALEVNGARPFLRGSCWTPRSWLDPEPAANALDREMRLLVDAGINCIRLSGCFTYASAALIAACDRHGIMVWQDLMFSVLDYPDDDAFARACEVEVAQQTALLQSAACVLVVCGSAEVDQQAAMTGVALDAARHSLFHRRLSTVVSSALPNVTYWPSTPNGGAVPFRTDVGTAHYFGVGAYRRPLEDARRSGVRFTTECLAFSQLPEPESSASLSLGNDDASRALWKRRVPRDGGANWDFESTRDFYVGHLFGVEPASLRDSDPERYLALGRAAAAIAVERTMQEFRRAASPCQGAITWLWADPWPGAGWGHIDSSGRRKSSWYAMRRALRPTAIALSNEGMNGVDVHAWNDGPVRVDGELLVRLLRDDGSVMVAASRALSVEGGRSVTLSVEEILGRFVDVAHAYRFGARSHDVVHTAWVSGASSGIAAKERATFEGSTLDGRALIDDATLFVHGDARASVATGLTVTLGDCDRDGERVLALTTSAVAQMVRVGSAAYEADDSYFTLAPGVVRRVRLSLVEASAERVVIVEALNDPISRRLTIESAPANPAIASSPRAIVPHEIASC